ncbi:MAG: hypothetical protein KAI81_06405, partial [Candidatus Marinimicrobia bacterium]|nr:hypothetical protein [Candidatus Neomarinimicrobiota bacterium]
MHKKHQSRCPLCNYSNIEFYFEDKFRHYLHCPVCDLVFVPSEFHLSPEAEKTRYDLHNNNPKDPGYQKFLSRLSNPLLQELSTQQSGLDFGCGPGPALAQMMEKA